MNKKIARILPLPMKPIGELLASVHCRSIGLANGIEEFDDEFKSYVFNFNDEAYGMSMTPSGLIASNHSLVQSNPATPKISETYFDLTKGVFGEDGFLNTIDATPDKKVNYKRQLRGNIASIVHLLLETKYNAKIKGKNGEYSDFQHRKDETPEERQQTLLNQYLRLFYTVKLIKALDSIFDKEPVAISDILDEVFGEKWRKETEKFLYPKSNRVSFVNHIYNDSPVPVTSSEQIKKGNPVKARSPKSFYKADNGLYFHKHIIDSIAEAKKDDVCQLTPKKEYIQKFDIDKEQYINVRVESPVIFGSYVKADGKVDYFIVKGKEVLLKILDQGIPVLDAIKLTPQETIKSLINCADNQEKIDMMIYNLKKFFRGATI